MPDDVHWDRAVKKTRREYTCNGCLEKIPAGSPARRIAGRFDGDFYRGILCIPCAEYLDSNWDEGGWYDGEIGDMRMEARGQ